MDWLTFFSKIVDSIAWPTGIVIVVLILKKPLGSLLPLLRNLKYKDLELSFGDELKKIEDKANKVLSAEKKPKQIAKEPVKRDSSELIKESKRLFEDFPDPAVAVAWSAVEAELLAAIMRTASSPDYPPNNSPMKNARFLQDAGYLKSDKIDLLKRMSNLRNMAVHGGGMPITIDDAREFIALTEWIVKDLKEITR
ncbi:hypothetical protein [Shewanella aegiceratis]|uniref:hypothetical protein n=1 Tax=Shewanella aegiceratis TaxID=2864203 RepID=UPI001C65E93B|nr:hypothetical protein [Shewanella aegiceratis]QYJ83662.1 hypothetical protein K0H80_06495 [Shewanella aegiceratis]